MICFYLLSVCLAPKQLCFSVSTGLHMDYCSLQFWKYFLEGLAALFETIGSGPKPRDPSISKCSVPFCQLRPLFVQGCHLKRSPVFLIIAFLYIWYFITEIFEKPFLLTQEILTTDKTICKADQGKDILLSSCLVRYPRPRYKILAILHQSYPDGY